MNAIGSMGETKHIKKCKKLCTDIVSSFSERHLDGLAFSKLLIEKINMLYDLDTSGEFRRLGSSREWEKIKDELRPIAIWSLRNTSIEFQFDIEWSDSNRKGDANIYGKGIKNKGEVFQLEVTTVRYENTHLVKSELNQKGYSYGPKLIKKDKESGTVDSEPFVRSGNEHLSDYLPLIKGAVTKKEKQYEGHVLIVAIDFHYPMDEEEWRILAEAIKTEKVCRKFKNVFFIDQLNSRTFSVST